MSSPQSLRDLFIIKLKALYDIEQTIVEALPTMASEATDPDLKAAFENHVVETNMQVKRLEGVFELLEEEPETVKVEAIRGLVEDAEWLIELEPAGEILDAGLIGAARYVEHYEMAGYEGARALAETLGYDEIMEMLDQSLEEEKAADMLLSSLAEDKINPLAATIGGDEEGTEEEE
jgi:ferritin-like metal-binding protein YciE